MMAGPNRQGDVFLGRFVKPHGIRGELKLYASDDFWFEALASKRLFIARETGDTTRRAVRVERAQPHQKQYIVKLEGIDDRSGAEEHVGANLFVDIAELDVALPDVELPYQVIGMRVRTEDGREIGTITGVITSTAQAIYQVTGETGTVLIPAVPAFIIARDSERGEMTVRPIPGLLDG